MVDCSRILLVEDNQDDAFIFEKALRKAGLFTSLHHAHDGEQAIDYLSGAGPFADRSNYPFPSVVFIDLKMPKVTGFDLLAWIQKEILNRSFYTIILTGSELREDKARASFLGADHYWVKPVETSNLVELLESLKIRLRPSLNRTILLIEDMEDDFIFIRKACEDLDLPVRVVHVPNGVEAFKYIAGKEPYVNREDYPLPDLILLDVDLPGDSGFEILQKLNALPQFRVPTVVITGSLSERDKLEALFCGASDCLEKPFSVAELTKAMALLQKRFLSERLSN